MENLPKISLGAWAWGNDGTFGNNLIAESLKPIFDTAMENGLNLWDTAYAYGMGTSEKVLAGFLKGLPRESYLISDKFTPQCADASSTTAMKDNYELENFDHFICRILATYADEAVLNEQGKINYHTFKPVLFEFPTYEYFVTGEKVGNCGKMN